MGLLSFGAQRGFMPTEPVQPDPTMAVKPSGWQDKLGLIGATLRDVGSSLNGQGGNALAQQQQMMQGRGRQAAQQAALQQVAGSITDPQERAVFAADPETWFKIYGERQKPQTLSEGQGLYAGGKEIATRGKTGVDGGFGYHTDPATGQIVFDAQRPETYSETQARQQNDPNTLGGLSWGRVQDSGLGRDRLALDTTKAAQDYRLGMGNLGVSQGQLSLGRQRLSLDQGGGAPPSGYRKTATGGLEFIPGGPADPNAAKRAAPTEDQAKTEFNLGRMRNASKAIDPLESAGFDRGASLTPGVINPKRRSYDNAKAEWLDALIRQTTGAAATKQEIEQADKAYFPQFGDPPNEIARKAQARTAAQTGSATRAGPAEKPASNGWSIVR